MQMEPVTSSLISHRGYDADKQLMRIRFTSKTHKYGSLYEYGNISETFYSSGLVHTNTQGQISFGQWFQLYVKPFHKEYPFRKISDPQNETPVEDAVDGTLDFDAPTPTLRDTLAAAVEQTVDFESGAPIQATTPIVEPLIPDTPRIQAARKARTEASTIEGIEDAEAELKAAQEEAIQAQFDALKAQIAKISTPDGSAIVIKSPDAASLAYTTGVAIARMRDALEKTMRPEIERLRSPYTAALAVFNRYEKPLFNDQERLRRSLATYNIEQRHLNDERNRELRRQQQIEAEAEATRKAQELQLHDAIAAEARGETDLAEQIIAAQALPMTPIMPPPVRVISEVPKEVAKAGRKKLIWEMLDESKIPDEYWIVDTKAIDKLVDAIGERAGSALNGAIRAYDAGTVAFSRK